MGLWQKLVAKTKDIAREEIEQMGGLVKSLSSSEVENKAIDVNINYVPENERLEHKRDRLLSRLWSKPRPSEVPVLETKLTFPSDFRLNLIKEHVNYLNHLLFDLNEWKQLQEKRVILFDPNHHQNSQFMVRFDNHALDGKFGFCVVDNEVVFRLPEQLHLTAELDPKQYLKAVEDALEEKCRQLKVRTGPK
jgi:hypothetical protein